MTMKPSDFWQPCEEVIQNYDDLAKTVDDVFKKWSAKNRVFAWRGLADSNWPLHSSLYRRVFWTKPSAPPEEHEIYRYEGKILAEVHRWGLHTSNTGGRLSILSQLAALQHYGAPTRLIDVTFNPWIGAWFAVQQKWDNGAEVHANVDARLFAVDVTGRLINENNDHRAWEDELCRPWPSGSTKDTSDDGKREYHRWCTKVYAWRPAHFDPRIAAQNGGFLFGGVPMSVGPDGPNQWPKADSKQFWKIRDVRRATSISLRPHKLQAKRGGVSQDAV